MDLIMDEKDERYAGVTDDETLRQSLRARIVELEDERDRWYGAAHERMIKINGLESTCRVQGQVIADQRARIEVLEKAIEWTIQYLERDVFNVDEVNALIEWMIDELRRKEKEGKP